MAKPETYITTRGPSRNWGGEPEVQFLHGGYVYPWSIGMAIDVTEKAQILVGWNHTRNAIPSETLSPAFNLTTENEADLGLIYRISPKWEIGAVVQYQFDHDITYDNPNQPFGPGAKEHYSLIGIDIGITRRW